MKKLDKAIMIIELVAGFAMLVLGIIQDSWIVGWCSAVCIMSGFFIGVNSEITNLYEELVYQNKRYQEFLEGVQKVCREAIDEKESQGSSTGSSSGS